MSGGGVIDTGGSCRIIIGGASGGLILAS